MKGVVFHLGLATLFTHELDAMPNHEWRGMPLLRALPDETGMLVFVVAHIPFFAALVALVSSSNPRIRDLSRIGIGSFLLIHGLLHGLSIGQPNYEFSSTLSELLIFGGSALGAVYLLLEAKDRSTG